MCLDDILNSENELYSVRFAWFTSDWLRIDHKEKILGASGNNILSWWKTESIKKNDLLHTLLPCCFQMSLTEDVMLKLRCHLMNGGNSQHTQQNAWNSLILSLKHALWYSLLLEFLLKENIQVPAVEVKIIQIFYNLKITYPHWMRCPLWKSDSGL